MNLFKPVYKPQTQLQPFVNRNIGGESEGCLFLPYLVEKILRVEIFGVWSRRSSDSEKEVQVLRIQGSVDTAASTLDQVFHPPHISTLLGGPMGA